jgi:drug/metabolite transporter (DMT)-like permease
LNLHPTGSSVQWALALVFITPLLWTVNYLAGRWAPGVVEPHVLAASRWLIAALLFSLGHWAAIWSERDHIRQHWQQYLVLGALGMWICGAWVYIGARTTQAANISLIYSISPVLVVLVSAIWLHERVSRWQAMGVALALAGVLHIVLKGQWLHLAEVQWVPGDAWILAAVLSWTIYSILLKRWHSPLAASPRLAVIALFGVAVMLPFVVWELGGLSAWGGSGAGAPAAQAALTWKGLLLILAVALFPGYGAYLAFSVMQRELGAARAGIVLYLGPLYAAVVGWLVLGEPLGFFHLVGTVLILPGIWLASRR